MNTDSAVLLENEHDDEYEYEYDENETEVGSQSRLTSNIAIFLPVTPLMLFSLADLSRGSRPVVFESCRFQAQHQRCWCIQVKQESNYQGQR